MILGGGATDPSDIGDILDQMVNGPSLEPFEEMTGEQFVKGATANMKKIQTPDFALQDYLASYHGKRFFESVGFVRDYPESALRKSPSAYRRLQCHAKLRSANMIPYVPVSNAELLHKGLPKSKLDLPSIAATLPGKMAPQNMAVWRLIGDRKAATRSFSHHNDDF